MSIMSKLLKTCHILLQCDISYFKPDRYIEYQNILYFDISLHHHSQELFYLSLPLGPELDLASLIDSKFHNFFQSWAVQVQKGLFFTLTWLLLNSIVDTPKWDFIDSRRHMLNFTCALIRYHHVRFSPIDYNKTFCSGILVWPLYHNNPIQYNSLSHQNFIITGITSYLCILLHIK